MYVNDFVENKVNSSDNLLLIKISEGIKFKVNSDNLLHSLEIFRVKDKDFFSTVARFHLPCVRAFYDGNNVYILPSCITAMLTGYNIDYKYFAGIRDPIDIITKYRIRGYSTIINPTEKQHMAYYCSSIDKWNGLFKIDGKNKESIKSLFGINKLDSEIYKIKKYMKNVSDDVYNKLNHQYIITNEDLQNWYNEKYPMFASKNIGIDLLSFTTINSEGSINPIKTWVFDAIQDYIYAK